MNKLPHPPPLRLTQAVYISATAAYKGGIDRIALLPQVMSCHQTFVPLMWAIGIGLVLSGSHSPTRLTDKETFKYLDHFFFYFFFLPESHGF